MSGSSLKFFADAKANIVEVASNLLKIVTEEKEFLKENVWMQKELIDEKVVEGFENDTNKIEAVLQVVQRGRMKVVFFGRTSNGKSTVVNAMLGSKILPSGLGHTTNCFVQVEGSDDDEACLIKEGCQIDNVKNLRELASALSSKCVSTDSLITIRWPKKHCALLKEDLVLVDSPGIDVTGGIDGCIDKHCMDADVFVLVLNAESTLMQTEKNFFHRVSSRLSKPNIFILNNRWDASSYEEDTVQQVRQQHLERCSTFLVDELQCILPHLIPQRVFFVSALESLKRASSSSPTFKTQPQSSSSLPPHTPSSSSSSFHHTTSSPQTNPSTPPTPPSSLPLLTTGTGTGTGSTGYRVAHMQRLMEFEAFERAFEDCISKTAVTTKFHQHICNLHNLNHHIMSLWESVAHDAVKIKNLKLKELHSQSLQLCNIQESNKNSQQIIKKNIDNTSMELSHRMGKMLQQELNNSLPSILDDFNKYFDSQNPSLLNSFKRDLNFHVEECLTRNLHLHFTPLARTFLSQVSQFIIDTYLSMLPECKHAQLQSLCPPRDFQVVYKLECYKLCEQFSADLRFHFWLGFTSLFERFTGSTLGQEEWWQLIGGSNDDTTKTLLTSPSTVTGMALFFIASRAVGVRILLTCTVLYTLLYTYEKLTWGKHSRKEAYMKQYTQHTKQQLHKVKHILSSSCSLQVESELVHVSKKCDEMLCDYEAELEERMQDLHQQLQQLQHAVQQATLYSSKHDEIQKQLDVFKLSYNL